MQRGQGKGNEDWLSLLFGLGCSAAAHSTCIAVQQNSAPTRFDHFFLSAFLAEPKLFC